MFCKKKKKEKSRNHLEMNRDWQKQQVHQTKDYLNCTPRDTVPFVICASTILSPHPVIHSNSSKEEISIKEQNGKKIQKPHLSWTKYLKEQKYLLHIPNNKEGISIQVISLNNCIIILKNYFHEAPICSINNGRLHDWWSSSRRSREISCIHVWLVIQISKSQWCLRWYIRDPI